MARQYRLRLKHSVLLLFCSWSHLDAARIPKGNDKGLKNYEIQGNIRVVNGVEVTDPREYEFVADLSMDKELVSSTRYCTGTLIRSDIILTAAHCVLNHGEMGDGTYATIGRINLKDNHMENRASETFRAVAAYVHPDYEGLGSNADVALLLLSGHSKKEPVCLAEQTPSKDSTAWIVGYGIQTFGTVEGTGRTVQIMPKNLQQTALRIMDPVFCSDYEIQIARGMLCTAGLAAGSSACRGDSGGGLFQAGADGQKLQVGVVSYGDATCMSDNGGVFTDVSVMREWINDGIKRLQKISSDTQALSLRKNKYDLHPVVHTGVIAAHNDGRGRYARSVITDTVKLFRVNSTGANTHNRVTVSVCTKRGEKEARLFLVDDEHRNLFRDSFLKCGKNGFAGHRLSFDGKTGIDLVGVSIDASKPREFEIRVDVKPR